MTEGADPFQDRVNSQRQVLTTGTQCFRSEHRRFRGVVSNGNSGKPGIGQFDHGKKQLFGGFGRQEDELTPVEVKALVREYFVHGFRTELNRLHLLGPDNLSAGRAAARCDSYNRLQPPIGSCPNLVVFEADTPIREKFHSKGISECNAK